MDYDGLIFDHDGVLVDVVADGPLTEAIERAFEAASVPDPSPADVDALTVGIDPAEVRIVADRHGLDPATLWRHREDAVHGALKRAVAAGRKGPYDDVALLADLERPLGVASNNQSRTITHILDHHGLTDLFGTVQARESTFESLALKKPDPTLLEAAMDELDVSNPLYIGDSESDVRAARRAGVDVAFLRRPHNADRTLSVSPTYEVDGLDAILELSGSGSVERHDGTGA